MGGEGSRNGRHPVGGAPAFEAIPDVFDRLRRRTLGIISDLIAEGALPASLDLGRFTVAPPRPATWGDAVVDAGLVYAGLADATDGAGPAARRLAPELAGRLEDAPEVEAAAVRGNGLIVLTLRRASLFAAVAGVLRRYPGGSARPFHGAPPRTGRVDARNGVGELASLAAVRAAVAAEMRAAQAAAAGGPEAPAPARSGFPPLRPVLVHGRWPEAPPGGPPGCGAVLAWIGMDAFRFAVASCRDDAALRLDLDVLGDRCRADPSFSVRYAHARARGILRRAASVSPPMDLGPVELAAADWSGLTDEGEVLLARLVAQHAHVVASGSPQRLAAHLRRVAEAVHSQWNRSKEQPQLRFVNEEMRDLAEARLGLVTAAALVLRSGLDILGITAPDEMR